MLPWFHVYRLDSLVLHRHTINGPINDAWMADDHEWKRVSTMSSTAQIESESPSSDAELAAATDGDPEARWRALEACRDYLRLVVRRGRWTDGAGRPATSDLVQGTVVDAWRQFSKFQGRTPGQLRAWLRAILIHASLKARRRPDEAQIGSGREVRAAPAPGSSPSQAAQKKDAGEALDAAIDGLMERHRTIIRLRIWEQLSFGQIGERLGVSEDGARMLYGRAIAKLRESMRPGHDPG
jgi:RNA polymerase sigma-70 factor, ECF subfamily